jgi:hypothetical protein
VIAAATPATAAVDRIKVSFACRSVQFDEAYNESQRTIFTYSALMLAA